MDAQEIKDRCEGRWSEIISSICNTPGSILDGEHHPCPKCGGKDRFNLDRDGSGSVFCNKCQPGTGDGIATVMWLNGWNFKRSLGEIDRHIYGQVAKQVPDATYELRNKVYGRMAELLPLSKPHRDALLARGLTNEEIDRRGYWSASPEAGFKIAGEYPTTADRELIRNAVPGICNRGCKIAVDNGLMIPVRDAAGHIVGVQVRPDKPMKKGGKYFWLSSRELKLSVGSPCHHALARTNHVDFANVVRITEGPLKADIATALSGIKTIAIAGVNSWAAAAHAIEAENPEAVWIAFDADAKTNPGVAKAAVDLFDHLEKKGFSVYLESWDAKHKGIDDALAAGAEVTILPAGETKIAVEHLRGVANKNSDWVDESEDDPQRLAKVNLSRYEEGHKGKLVYWRDEWWKWKKGKYRRIEPSELRAKIWASIRSEFERTWRERSPSDNDKPVRKVTKSLVANVIGATESMCCIPSSVPMPCWMPNRSRPHYVSALNGILDLDAVFDRRPADEWMVEHSPEWFSAFRLDYAFDANANCPKWIEYIDHCMDGDHERISILQEWAGYLLTGSNDLQKFLVLEGEGGNGKTVFFSGMTAMLGEDNVSHVSIENFGGRFELGTTIGKSANISGDAGEIDGIAEGVLKQFTGGDIMQFDRKNIAPISARPTAKLMAAWNGRPRIKDKSMGLWRRMILVPFDKKISKERRVLGMDTPGWWLSQGEAPGILLWAIAGLYRLRQQGGFTSSTKSDAAAMEYREESNPAMRFLNQFVSPLPPDVMAKEMSKPLADQLAINSDELYVNYKDWCREESISPLAKQNFGKQVARQFGDLKHRRGPRGDRYFVYRLLTLNEGF